MLGFGGKRLGNVAQRGAEGIRRIAELNADENAAMAVAIITMQQDKLAALWVRRQTRDRHIEKLAAALESGRLKHVDELLERAEASDPLRLRLPHGRRAKKVDEPDAEPEVAANGVAR
jgi:hypothetical protein